MTTTLPNTGVVTPTLGGDAGVWGSETNDAWANYDAHDHGPGKGVRITPAAININADLPLNSSWGITAANRISFASVAATSTNKSLFVSDGTSGLAANELYWRSNSGNQVRLTNGSALNVAAFAGGIGGDYVAVSAALNFDDAGDRYTFKQNSGTGWARLASGDLRLFETGTSETIFVGLAAPAALAGSYTVTMPLAAPGSTSLVQMDSSGVLSASNTVANALTLSSALQVNAAVTSTSTVATTGSNLTSNGHRVQLKAPAALAADYDITMPGALPAATQVMRLSSTGVVTAASASETRTFGATFGVPSSLGGTRNTGATTGGGYITLGTSTGVNWLPLTVSVGEVITAWSIRVQKTSATGTISAVLVETDASLVDANIGTAATNGAVSPGFILMFKSGLSATVANDKSYRIDVTGGGTTGDTIIQYQVTVTVSP
jgi:hypothetical protein